MTISFTDRVVLVTGAGTGLGRSHALAFANAGAAVVVNDPGATLEGVSTGDAPADLVVSQINSIGARALADYADVTDREAVAAMITRTIETFGRLDVVVNNAGILRDRSFQKMDDSDWDDVLAVHLTGTANVCRAAWPVMRDQGYGRIVVTSSSSGLFGNFGQTNYGAAKMGIIGLMNTVVIEGQKHGIRINAISPIAWTRMTASLFPPAGEALMAAQKVTPGVVFLASEDAPNGVILVAGGGAFSVARIVETEPVVIGPEPTADDIAAAFPQINDLTTAKPVVNGPLHTASFFQAAAKAHSSS